jgi:hypothetical protein
MVTTVISDEGIAEAEETEESFHHRISWPSIFVGAVVGAATIFFLLTLGAGVGLSLAPASGVATKGFLTLGAIYFFAAQAFGFAVGGHLVGRLIGPMAETDREEEFRAAAHGLAVWGLCVTATALLVLMSSWVAAGSNAIAGGLATAPGNANTAPAPAVAAYWTDVLFRPATLPMHASLAWQRYAQAETTGTDAAPPDDEAQPTVKPMTPVPGNGSNATTTGKVENDVPQGATVIETVHSSRPGAPHVITIPTGADNETGVVNEPGAMPANRNIGADKAEAGRVLEVGMANGGTLSQYDRGRLADLIVQDTGISSVEAARRVDNAQARIRADQKRTAEAARKLVRNASLWMAFALLFGAVVAAMAAISARWEDDRITFGLPRRGTDQF